MAKGRGGQLVRPGVVIREELSRESPLSISELYRRYRARYRETYKAIGRKSRPGTYNSFRMLVWKARRLQLVELVDEVPPVGSPRYYDELGRPHGRPIDDALRARLQATGDFHNQRRFRLTSQAAGSNSWLDITSAFMGLFVPAPTIEVLPAPAPVPAPPPKAPPVTKANEKPTPKPRPVPRPKVPEVPPALGFDDIQDMLAHRRQLKVEDFQSILDGYLALILEFEAKPTKAGLQRLKNLDLAIFDAMVERMDGVSRRDLPILEQMVDNVTMAAGVYDDLEDALARGNRQRLSAGLQTLKKCCVKVV